MVGDIADKKIETVIIGSSVYGALKVPKSTIEYLKLLGIESVLVKKIPVACQIYNDMIVQGKNPALFAHGTC